MKNRFKYGWSVPLSALILSLCGEGAAGFILLAYWLIAQALTFFADDCLQRALAMSMSKDQMGRHARTAICMLIPAAILCVWLTTLPQKAYSEQVLTWAMLMQMLARCMQAVLAAENDPYGALSIDILTTIGLILSNLGFVNADFYAANLAATGFPAVLSVIFARKIVFSGHKLSVACLKELPRVLARNLIFYAALIVTVLNYETELIGYIGLTLSDFTLPLFALIMVMGRPLFLRRGDEGAGWRAGCAIAMLILAGLTFAFTSRDAFATSFTMVLFLGMGLTFWVYGPLRWQTGLIGILSLWGAAGMACNLDARLILIGFAVEALLTFVLSYPDFAALLRHHKAGSIQKGRLS